MPPAGLEPAALCLASSIRLSLTAHSRVCWLDYILDITVPARIVSEEPLHVVSDLGKVSCGLPNPHGLLLKYLSTRGSKGVPAYGAVHSVSSSKKHFLTKAPTRQMLYPLSYRGTCLEARC
jgi:hypothetical protein